MQSIDS